MNTLRKPVVVLAADTHLKTHTWVKIPELKLDSFRSFEQIIDHSLDHHLPLILLGDIIDVRNPEPVVIGFLFDQLRRLETDKLECRFIEGQHELNHERPWLSCHYWPIHVHRKSFTESGIKFYGMNYTSQDNIKQVISKIPSDTDVLLAHQVWKEQMSSLINREFKQADASFLDVPYVKMIATGDFHRHISKDYTRDDGTKITTLSPGSTYMKAIDEPSDKYFYVLYDDLSFESIKLKTRPFLKSVIESANRVDQVLDFIKRYALDNPVANEATPIWSVDYDDSIPDLHSRLEEAAKDKAFLFARPLKSVKTRIENNYVAKEDVDDKSGLISFLPQKCNPDSDVYKTAVRLIKSNNIKAERDDIVREFKNRELGL